MRLLQISDDGGVSLVDVRPGNNELRYAILSHTWGSADEEVSFSNLAFGTGKEKAGYFKIVWCGQQAQKDGLHYFWVDTCCIDKTNSQELQESINSMYRWYQEAEKCYVYLSDVSNGPIDGQGGAAMRSWKPAFRKSKWFTRGWTLQELIAPASVQFFSKEGLYLGSKRSLEGTISEITTIATPALRQQRTMSQFGVEERFAWAGNRITTREEDAAYCLLGIFDVQMPLVYAEGREKALKRLRREIRVQHDDDEASQVQHERNGDLVSIEPLDRRKKDIEKRRGELMRSLPFDHIDSRRMSIRKAHSKTCGWLLERPEYIAWLEHDEMNRHHGLLWIKGKPGSGKSTLLNFAYAHTREMLQETVAIAFFFNARGGELERSTIGTYRSLLAQLLGQMPALQSAFDAVGDLATGGIQANFQWSVEILEVVFEEALQQLGETFVVCFIDALDECDELLVREMVRFFERMGDLAVGHNVQFRVCFTSRHYPHITINKGLSLCLEEQNSRDISNYIESELRIGHTQLAQHIRKEVQEKASGIFMWTVMVVGILNKEYDGGRIHALRKKLQETPNDLHDLIRSILLRDLGLNSQKESELCLLWVLFARRPLKPEELYFAILAGSEPDAAISWDCKELTTPTMERFILNASKGLTEITNSSHRIVQFIHESVREFLLKDGLRTMWPQLGERFQGQSHEALKQCCTRNIHLGSTLHQSAGRALDAKPRPVAKGSSYPFLEYAVENVWYHANEAAAFGIDQRHFLSAFELRPWIQLDNLRLKDVRNRHTLETTLIYILAEHNMPYLLKSCGSALSYIEVSLERCGPPLFAAITFRSHAALEVMIEQLEDCGRDPPHGVIPTRGKSRFDGRQWYQPWSFEYSEHSNIPYYLAEMGNSELLSLLLRAGMVEIDRKERMYQRTPLSVAAKKGRWQVVNILLESGRVEVDSKDSCGQTPLWFAINHGRKAIMQLLLKFGADINLFNVFGETPLLSVVKNRHLQILRTLLEETHADPNSSNRTGETALIVASRHGYIHAAKLLLNAGKARPDLLDRNGHSALWWAKKNRHEAVVRFLLKTGNFDCAEVDDVERPSIVGAIHAGHVNVSELVRARMIESQQTRP